MEKETFADVLAHIGASDLIDDETKREWRVYIGNPHITRKEKRKKLAWFYDEK
jgi:hypothetical protein